MGQNLELSFKRRRIADLAKNEKPFYIDGLNFELNNRQDLDTALEKSLKDALEEIGGASVRDSVLYYLREKYGIKLERISSNPMALVRALTDIFGVGEALVEKKMAEKFSATMNLKSSSKSLQETIKQARIESEA